MEYSKELDDLKADLRELRAENKRLKTEVERYVRSDKRHDSNSDNYGGSSPSDAVANKGLNVEATFYTAWCPSGCIGITKTGLDVRNTIYTPDGYRIIAVDPSVIPLGSTVKVTLENGDSFTAKAEDTGGAIRGKRIDVLVETKQEAYYHGRQSAKVEVLNEGER